MDQLTLHADGISATIDGTELLWQAGRHGSGQNIDAGQCSHGRRPRRVGQTQGLFYCRFRKSTINDAAWLACVSSRK
ncbi:hypothetical protein [Mesorhizobium sp. B2-6-2]|uniref:hypothetical protein n=1 Tax=Mesorhizobium sp. B2-6-2 TaxID=2589915 RepID=UPI0015E402B0|nr:hypothetical protein [Mesorhizobium sp. B2-6-2]